MAKTRSAKRLKPLQLKDKKIPDHNKPTGKASLKRTLKGRSKRADNLSPKQGKNQRKRVFEDVEDELVDSAVKDMPKDQPKISKPKKKKVKQQADDKTEKKEKQTYQCDICQKVFLHPTRYDIHMSSHQRKENLFMCHYCGKSHGQSSELVIHLRSHTGEKPFSCETCGKSFPRNSSLLRHLRDLHSTEERKSFICEFCSKSYVSHSGLLSHQRSRHGDPVGKFECNICHKRFKTKFVLQGHELTHTGFRKFNCNVCSAAFYTKTSLKRHIRSHTKEKPHICNICNKGFSQPGNLKIHIKTHEGFKKYKCTKCDQAYTRIEYLERHEDKEHSGISGPVRKGRLSKQLKLPGINKKNIPKAKSDRIVTSTVEKTRTESNEDTIDSEVVESLGKADSVSTDATEPYTQNETIVIILNSNSQPVTPSEELNKRRSEGTGTTFLENYIKHVQKSTCTLSTQTVENEISTQSTEIVTSDDNREQAVIIEQDDNNTTDQVVMDTDAQEIVTRTEEMVHVIIGDSSQDIGGDGTDLSIMRADYENTNSVDSV